VSTDFFESHAHFQPVIHFFITVADTDEPLLSGSGEVTKDCSDRVLSDWGIVLNRWRADLSRRPTGIRALVRSGSGVPEPLRGEVWQLLAGCYDNSEMLETYRVLITQVGLRTI